MRIRVRRVIHERGYLATALAGLPDVLRVYPSAANFLLVKFADAKSVHSALLAAAVRVRAFEDPVLQDCLRITIGSREDNERLLAVLRQREWRHA